MEFGRRPARRQVGVRFSRGHVLGVFNHPALFAACIQTFSQVGVVASTGGGCRGLLYTPTGTNPVDRTRDWDGLEPSVSSGRRTTSGRTGTSPNVGPVRAGACVAGHVPGHRRSPAT